MLTGRPGPVLTDTDLARFASHAERWGLHPTALQLARVRAYVSELLRWNERINLTSAREPEEILVWHVLDSLAAVAHLEGAEVLLDVGSGAGLPGIPIKIFLPALHVVLLEARRKRAAFMEHVVAELDLEGIEVVWGRIEQFPGGDRPGRRGFDAIIARASVPDLSLFTTCRHLIRPGGRLFLMKGALGTRRAETLGREAGARGWTLLSVWPYRLPGAVRARNLVTLGPAPPDAPRCFT